MEKKKKKKIILGTTIPAAVIIALTTAFYFLIPVFAKSYITQKISEYENEHHAIVSMNDLQITDYSITGRIDLTIKDLHIKGNTAKEEFASVNDLNLQVQAWRGLKITKEILDINAQKVGLNVVKHGEYNNYAFLKNKKKKKETVGYTKLVSNLLELSDKILPNQMSVKQLSLTIDIDSIQDAYTLRDIRVKEGKLNGLFITKTNGCDTRWLISGSIDKQNHAYSGALALADASAESAGIPIGGALDDANVKFSRLGGELKVLAQSDDCLKLAVSGQIRELQFFHRYIAEQPVEIEQAGGTLNLTIRSKSVEIDSSSTLSLNKAVVHPFVHYEKNAQGKKHIIFKINEIKTSADALFSSLPEGLFSVLPKMKVHGDIDYHITLDCDFALLDSLKFDFDLRSKDRTFGFDAGSEEITRYNETFEYTFYENGVPLRTVVIGPENGYFCSFAQVPKYLVQSILGCEDGGFFYHRGFCKSSIENALIADIKSGKLRRGGSTMSQQLVKNLFLNRKKVFSRKIEEMILVWLIEDYRMLSKERMFEIYVNIAEWGPGIIGIGEAAEFYFHKKPQELTLGECVYLATLIRAPKHYRSTVNADGTLTDAKRAEIEFVAQRMVERNLITEGDMPNFDSNVKICLPEPTSEDATEIESGNE